MTATMSRRMLLGAASAAPFFLGPRVSAIQYAGYVEAVAAVIGAAMSVMSGSRTADIQRQVGQINAKLDLVLANQERILQELVELRIFVADAIRTGFRQADERELRARGNEFRIETTARNRAKYSLLADSIKFTTDKLGLYDFSAFIAFMAGVSMVMTLHRLLNSRSTILAQVKSDFREALTRWLSADDPDSIKRAIKQQQWDIQAKKAEIDSYPRQIPIGQKWTRDSGQRRCTMRTVVVISGDLESGFSAAIQDQEISCHTRREPEGPRGRDTLRVANSTATLPESATSSPVAPGPDYSDIPEPGPLGSGNAYADDLNNKRNEWIAWRRRERDLVFLEVNIGKALELLS